MTDRDRCPTITGSDSAEGFSRRRSARRGRAGHRSSHGHQRRSGDRRGTIDFHLPGALRDSRRPCVDGRVDRGDIETSKSGSPQRHCACPFRTAGPLAGGGGPQRPGWCCELSTARARAAHPPRCLRTRPLECAGCVVQGATPSEAREPFLARIRRELTSNTKTSKTQQGRQEQDRTAQADGPPGASIPRKDKPS